MTEDNKLNNPYCRQDSKRHDSPGLLDAPLFGHRKLDLQGIELKDGDTMTIGKIGVEEIKRRQRTISIEDFSDMIMDQIITAPKNHLQEQKPPAHLLPMDILQKYITPAYQEGLIKYFRESWRMGFPVSVMISAALRHITDFFWKGEEWDSDTEKLYNEWEEKDPDFIRPPKKHHLGAAIFALLCVLQTMETRPDLDDRPPRLMETRPNLGPKGCTDEGEEE